MLPSTIMDFAVIILTLFLILLVSNSHLSLPFIYRQAHGESPIFVRQEIKDSRGDWQLWKGPFKRFNVTTHEGTFVQLDIANNLSDCKLDDQFLTPDIESVSYKSNGKTLDGAIWLTYPFREPSINDSLDYYQENLQISMPNDNSTLDTFTIIKLAEKDLDDSNVENTTLSGLPARRLETIGNDIQNLNVWTVYRNKIYDITFSAQLSKYKDYYPIVQEILNSFSIDDLRSNLVNKVKSIERMTTFRDSHIRFDFPSDWENNQKSNDEGRSITLLSPFEDTEFEQPAWHETTFTMAIDLNSVYDTGMDYRIIYSRMPHGTWTGNWTRQEEEVSAYDKSGFMEEKPNVTVFNKTTPYRIPFSFDLESVNSPSEYKVLFYITDYYVLNHHFCRLVDTTNWVIVPPPTFVMSTSPSSVQLRPGEEKNIILEIKGVSNLQSEATLSINNTRNDLLTNFVPNRISIPISSPGASSLYMKVFNNSTASVPTSVILPIKANITFPTSITNRGGDTFSNDKSISLSTLSNFTLTIIPPYSDVEKFDNFVKSVITPVSGMWTFLAGVGAVIAPLIVRVYRNRQKHEDKKI